MISYPIDHYAVSILSSRSTTDLGSLAAVISLYTGSAYRGKAMFYPDGTDLPAATVVHNSYIYLHFNRSELHAVVDLLRNEKPVWIYYRDRDDAGLTTEGEPVGEGE